jgi:hypothetical protein
LTYFFKVLFLYFQIMSNGSSVSKVTGYGLDNQVSLPERVGILSFTTTSAPTLGSTHPPVQWALGALSLGVKQHEHDTDNSFPSSAKVKNVWSFTATSPYLFMAWCLSSGTFILTDYSWFSINCAFRLLH